MKNFRFPKENRIILSRDFKRVYQQGFLRQNRYFKVFILNKNKTRLGLAVGKEIGSAVERNKIKRILREGFRTHKELFKNKDIIVQPKKGITRLKSEEIFQELLKLLK
jgi:ribonuclease P protein component